MDTDSFFREATIRICGTLDSDKAVYDALLLIRRYMPANRLSLHVFNRDKRVIETVAYANPNGSISTSIITPIPDQAAKRIRSISKRPSTRIVDDIFDDPLLALVARALRYSGGAGIISSLVIENRLIGFIAATGDKGAIFTREHARLIRSINEPFSVALANCLRYRSVVDLSEKLADESRYFQEELKKLSTDRIIGADSGLLEVMTLVRQVAPTTTPVFLLGETGVGKELIASAIHEGSNRSKAPFIKINCGAIPPSLIDSELFGHEKGAFTGALSMKKGRFERADSGTLFLDEIGELPPDAQVRLLRVLQEKEIERIGGDRAIKVDVRIIAATNRDIKQMVKEKSFREDLYFRLNVFPIRIPPLRERKEDIPALTRYFIKKKSMELGIVPAPEMDETVMYDLMKYDWPGNVRELENSVERALILTKGKRLEFSDILAPAKKILPSADKRNQIIPLDDLVRLHIEKALKITGGRIEGPKGAARLLRINPNTLRYRMKKLGILRKKGTLNTSKYSVRRSQKAEP